MATRVALIVAALTTAVGGAPTPLAGVLPHLQGSPSKAAGMHTQQKARPAPESEKLDVNQATRQQLEKVPGIGPATAKRIIEWRGQHGRFETLEELLNVRGIGTKTLDKLRAYLEVRSADAGSN